MQYLRSSPRQVRVYVRKAPNDSSRLFVHPLRLYLYRLSYRFAYRFAYIACLIALPIFHLYERACA